MAICSFMSSDSDTMVPATGHTNLPGRKGTRGDVKYHVHRHSDRVHFDSTGYDLACEDMLPVLVQTCTKVENAILLQRHLDARVAAQLDQEEERQQGRGTKKDK